jgi:hypothetical protein
MTLLEALEQSKRTGPGMRFMRRSPGRMGWVHTYRLSYEDLVADDWETEREHVERVTGGRWTT